VKINEITLKRFWCGTWRVADVRAARSSPATSSNGSLRIFHTPSMAEASHIAQMWARNDFSREAGRLQRFIHLKTIEKKP
jgi:hypothetical protein